MLFKSNPKSPQFYIFWETSWGYLLPEEKESFETFKLFSNSLHWRERLNRQKKPEFVSKLKKLSFFNFSKCPFCHSFEKRKYKIKWLNFFGFFWILLRLKVSFKIQKTFLKAANLDQTDTLYNTYRDIFHNLISQDFASLSFSLIFYEKLSFLQKPIPTEQGQHVFSQWIIHKGQWCGVN